jgi:tetratricopeptide (TPR) repeat protein
MRNGFPPIVVPSTLLLITVTLASGCQSTTIASRLFRRGDQKTQVARSTELPPANEVFASSDDTGQKAADAVTLASSVPVSAESVHAAHVVDQGAIDEKEHEYLSLLEQNPDSAATWNDLGVHYSNQEIWAPAADALEKAVALEPERNLYRNNLAVALVRAGHLADGLSEFTHSVGAAVAHYNVGYLLMQEGNDAESARQFLLAVMKDPDLEEASYWLNVLADKGVFSDSTAPSQAEKVAYDAPADPLEGNAERLED